MQRYDYHGRIEMLVRWMLEIQERSVASNRFMLDVLLSAVLFEFAKRPADREHPTAAAIRKYVQANLPRRLRLDELAQVAKMSRFHFARFFRKVTSHSPMSFVRQARVSSTRFLILTTNLPLKAIAQQVGFPDEYSLSRIFHHETGLWPSELRKPVK